MKKFLVISDTHGYLANLYHALELEQSIHGLIHLGDIAHDEEEIRAMLPDGAEVYMVRGNNDFLSELPGELTVDIGREKFLLCHGHIYDVNYTMEGLTQTARSRGVGIVLYGHTHVPMLQREKGVLLVNPGSLSLPRQKGRRPSYAIMYVDDSGDITFEQKYL